MPKAAALIEIEAIAVKTQRNLDQWKCEIILICFELFKTNIKEFYSIKQLLRNLEYNQLKILTTF